MMKKRMKLSIQTTNYGVSGATSKKKDGCKEATNEKVVHLHWFFGKIEYTIVSGMPKNPMLDLKKSKIQ